MNRRLLHLASALASASAIAAACAAGVAPVTYPVMPAALVPVDAEHNRARDFARVFCSTLSHLKDKDGRSWGDCAKYLDATDAPQPQTAIDARFKFLFVPGFGGECMKDVRAYSTSIAHLRDAHQIAVEYFAVAPFGSSEENGKSIARRIEEGWSGDASRRYVLIGYSKGATDILEALRVLDAPKTKVAAVVTIAGIVGGLWLPGDLRALMQGTQPWIAPGCPGNVEDGIHSVLRDVRLGFLRQNPLAVRRDDAAAPRSYEGRRGVPANMRAAVRGFSGRLDVDGVHRSGEPRGDGGAVSARADVSGGGRCDAGPEAIAAASLGENQRAAPGDLTFLEPIADAAQ